MSIVSFRFIQAMKTTESCDSVPVIYIYYFLLFARFRPELEIVKSAVVVPFSGISIIVYFSGVQSYQQHRRPKSVSEERIWWKWTGLF